MSALCIANIILTVRGINMTENKTSLKKRSIISYCKICNTYTEQEVTGAYKYKCLKCNAIINKEPTPEFNLKNYTMLYYRNMEE